MKVRRMCGEKTALVADIQRTSVHDGPGIRTTVFLKGCNMRCAWCHNPETVKTVPETVLNEKLCIHCGYCAEGCYSGARRLCGQKMNVSEVMGQVKADRPYYGRDGGMTVSGGEPFMQPEFTLELVKAAAKDDVHVGVETNLSLPFERIEPVIPFVDLWMVDIKAFTSEIHKKFVGTGNGRVLENLKKLDGAVKTSIVVRTPVVPGVNDKEEEIEKILAFADTLENAEYYEILPYHPLGLGKTVTEADFIRKFELPDKKNLGKILERLKQRYSLGMRMANIKM